MCACLCVCLCVYPSPKLLITSGVMWCDMDQLNKFYSCYIANVVNINDGHGLDIDTHHGN